MNVTYYWLIVYIPPPKKEPYYIRLLFIFLQAKPYNLITL